MTKRVLLLALLASLVTLGASRALAETFTLNFCGLQNDEQVLNYYDGGFGSLGSGPGPDYGITFTPSFLAIEGIPPYGPDRVGLLDGSTATMDVSDGFTTPFSFYYEASDDSGLVTVWSGPDGTGTMLDSFALMPAANWNPAAADFEGTAMSVVFSGTPDAIRFDVITNAGNVIPEPSSLLLLGTGLAGLAMGFRRRRA